ncbi:MAG: GtrA family protein [Acutalibacteraceae bacterium]
MINKLKSIIDVKLLKFLLVGVFNTIVGAGIMFLLYNLAGCSYWVSSASNYVVGSILSYFLNKYITFQNKDNSFRQIIKFVINILVCYGVAYGIAKPLVKMVLSTQSESLRDNVAMLVGMCLFTGLNYFGQRFFAFADDKKKTEK